MKIIHVYGDEYAAIEFEKYFKGKRCSDIIQEYFVDEKEYDGDFEMELMVFNDVDPEFIKFIKQEIMDYDMMKHENFYTEDQVIR